MGVLWAQLLLQFCTNRFPAVFFMVWGCACGLDIIVRFFFFFFFVNFVIFRPQCIDRRYLVSKSPHTILYRSFWNFAHVFSMVWRCACVLDIYNPCINFCHFFHFANFVIFWHQILWKCIDSGYLVSATLHTILKQSFWNFAHVFSSLEPKAHKVSL